MKSTIENQVQTPSEITGPKLYRAEVHGGGDLDVAPSVAVFEVDEHLARDIVRLSLLVKACNVYKIERFDYRAVFYQHDPESAPEEALQAGEENAVRTDCDCLVVTDSDFFFRTYVKHTDVGVECASQSIAELARHFDLHYGVSTTNRCSMDKGLIQRTSALALLRDAQGSDGLKPFAVTHIHSDGESTYVLWSVKTPTAEEAEAVLDCEFEPERGESLVVEESCTLEEMTGVDASARLPDILASRI